MRKTISLLLVLFLIIIISSCNKNSNEVIDIRGEIKEIYTDEENSLVLNFLVEGEKEDDTVYDSASVTIENNTEIYKDDEKATVDDLVEGIAVEVIFNGSVAESYPVQGTAKKVIILGY